jgi:hypothetical protein
LKKKGFITAFREILAPSREIFDDHDNRHLRQRVGPICQRTSGFQEAAHGHQPANSNSRTPKKLIELGKPLGFSLGFLGSFSRTSLFQHGCFKSRNWRISKSF